jgi:hypothetical protein
MIGLAFVVGCTTSSVATDSPTPSTSPTPIGGLPSICPDLDIQGPSGDRVNLTGTWYGPIQGWHYYVYQSGECIWWAGGFTTPSTAPRYQYEGHLGTETLVFTGRLASDFSLAGEWAAVRTNGRPPVTEATLRRWGTITGTIEFDQATGEPALLVQYVEHGGSGNNRLERMTKVSDESLVEP